MWQRLGIAGLGNALSLSGYIFMVIEVFARTDVLYGEFQIRHNSIYHGLWNFTFLSHEWPV